MSYADNMRTFSNINCFLGSLVSWGEQKQKGVDSQTANFNFFRNMTNGMARNEIAYDMARHGNYTGITTNLMAGYGNEQANMFGTTALLAANCPPWMFFNMYQPMPMGYFTTPMPMMGMGGYFGCPGGGFLC